MPIEPHHKKPIKILIAPLDWGLGHAMRCVPIIEVLQAAHCEVVLAGSGFSLELLKQHFPDLKTIELKGYNIRYSQTSFFFPILFLLQIPKMLIAIFSEHQKLKQSIRQCHIQAVISDNRYGCFHSTIPSVFITHQLEIKTPRWLKKIIQSLNYAFINRFSVCWVPDYKHDPNLAGTLSQPDQLPTIPVEYIGPLSRINATKTGPMLYKACIILSGPEPQRSMLEAMLITQLAHTQQLFLLIRGSSSPFTNTTPKGFTVKNYATTQELNEAYGQSEYIISRCGYTTVMDVMANKKKSILIPTPGQTEQVYLAQLASKQGWALVGYQQQLDMVALLQTADTYSFDFEHTSFAHYKTIIKQWVDSLSIHTA